MNTGEYLKRNSGYYFVTAYPTEVLNITDISDAGVMTYDVISTNIPEGSYVNVIFVVK
jgi:hypothetical protein